MGEIGEGYKKREDRMAINDAIHSRVDVDDTVFAEFPMAKPANHEPSASIVSPVPDPDPDPDPEPELAPAPNISVPDAPEYPIPYSDPDPDPDPDPVSDPNP